MGGRIWVESEVGKGSTFHFTARFALQRRSRSRLIAAAPANLRGLRVLLADDNATSRDILEEILDNWLMRPTVVGGGRAALDAMHQAAAAHDPFALALLDTRMPDMDGFTLAGQLRERPQLAGAVLMLCSGDPRDAARCRALGSVPFLTKPVKSSDLLQAIVNALELAGEGDRARGGTTALAAQPGRPLRVLLAEDNAVNQHLVVRLLEKHGHTVAVAGNGREALDLLDQESLDVVLMDVQMPEMSGLEATARVRAREEGTGRHLPIIALTAHAMKGDRERCLAAGMDNYLTKPVKAEDLFLALAAAVPQAGNAPTATSHQPSANLDRAALLERLEGDETLLRQLVNLFLDDYPRLLAAIRTAVAARDPARLEYASHALKGSAANFGPSCAVEAAHRLELLGRRAELAGAPMALTDLEEALQQFAAALTALGAHPAPSVTPPAYAASPCNGPASQIVRD
jgi:CheY-like chemotaxis protein